MPSLFEIRDDFIDRIDATGADMLNLTGWEKPTADQLQYPFLRKKPAAFFEAHHFDFNYLNQVVMEVEDPDVAIFLAACAIQARSLLFSITPRPDLHYKMLDFSTPAEALSQPALLDVMPHEDACRWSSTFRQSLSNHGQIELMARHAARA